MKLTILVVTTNAHKLHEIGAILKHPIEGLALNVIENGRTFEANAIKKAKAGLRMLKNRPNCCVVLADDSGLMVDCLNGRPGIKSARFATPPTPENLCNKLIRVMKNCKKRSAKFITVIAIVYPDGKVKTVKGVVRGKIIHEMRGTKGFGYDAVFMPDGYTKTFAEMSSKQKNKLSHRSQALNKARKLIK